MAMKLRTITETQQLALQRTLQSLRWARNHARMADCPRLLRAIQRAIKSAGGAERHAQRRTKLSLRAALKRSATNVNV